MIVVVAVKLLLSEDALCKIYKADGACDVEGVVYAVDGYCHGSLSIEIIIWPIRLIVPIGPIG